MNVFQMRDKLKDRLKHLDVKFSFNRDEETLRVSRNDNGKGVTVKLSTIVAKYKEQKENIVDEIVYYVEEAIEQMKGEALSETENIEIMPVLRSPSFDKKTKKVIHLL